MRASNFRAIKAIDASKVTSLPPQPRLDGARYTKRMAANDLRLLACAGLAVAMAAAACGSDDNRNEASGAAGAATGGGLLQSDAALAEGSDEATAAAIVRDSESEMGADSSGPLPSRCTMPPATSASLKLADFGAVADGATDDGPAIGRAIAAAVAKGGVVAIEFSAGKTYRALSGTHTFGDFSWLLEGHDNLIFSGHGATLLLGPNVRGIWADGVNNVTVCQLDIDFAPLPFSQGTIRAVAAGTFDLTIDDGYDVPPDVPAPPSGVPFFGKLHRVAEGDLLHYYPGKILGQGARSLRITALDANQPTPAVGDTFVVPVLGVGQRGPEVMHVNQSAGVTIEDVRLFSAPLFSTYISANTGAITWTRVAVMPKPGTTRLISSWRDAFHVKDNRGPITFDTCAVDSSQDDAFNVSAHWMPITQLVSPTRVRVSRPYTAQLPQLGDTVQVADMTKGALLGTVKVTGRDPTTNQIDLASTITGLSVGTRLVSLEGSNPGTIIRDTKVNGTGLRLRSQVTVDDSSFNDGTVLVSAYDVEGPIPYDVQFHRSTFNHRYDPVLALMELSGTGTAAPALSGIEFDSCTFGRRISLSDVTGATLHNNDFVTGADEMWLAVANAHNIVISGTTDHGRPAADVISKISLGANVQRSDILLQ